MFLRSLVGVGNNNNIRLIKSECSITQTRPTSGQLYIARPKLPRRAANGA